MTTTSPPVDSATVDSQSLAHGQLGTTLLHIEHALQGSTTWDHVHQQLTGISPLLTGPHASLYLGAPAMAYVLHLAAAGSNRYARTLNSLDHVVTEIARHRVAAAHHRIDQAHPTSFAEYDLFRGLTGIGALLLRRRPDSSELRAVLAYLVRLTQPLPGARNRGRPGWWVGHSPTLDKQATPGGHANVGIAHGITGPLALLALAHLRGVVVDGQEEAMQRICRWLDDLQHTDRGRIQWPRWVAQSGAERAPLAAPSWCYGTPGLARAQQLAALALGDQRRKKSAERALLSCIDDEAQLNKLTGRGLCHGFGGLLRTVQRVAQDADDPEAFTSRLPTLRNRFRNQPIPDEPGFLTGTVGAILVDLGTAANHPPVSEWDACLLLT